MLPRDFVRGLPNKMPDAKVQGQEAEWWESSDHHFGYGFYKNRTTGAGV